MGANMKITIRKAKSKDAKIIAELHKKVVSGVNSKYYPTEAIKEWIKDISEENVRYQFQNSYWIVAEIDNKVVGFGQYSVNDGEIDQINVDPDYLNQNIGVKMYNYMENNLRSRGVKKICLNSTPNATGFYQKLGFKKIQETNLKSIKMIKMEKSLRTQK